MKVQILTPSTGFCRMAYTYSLVKMVMYCTQNRFLPECNTQVIDFRSIEGSMISANRERLIDEVLKTDCTHILFIDEDMDFDPRTLHTLAGRRQKVVGCNYPMRGPTGSFTALSLDRKTRVWTDEKSGGLELCFYTGFGFCLIERNVFEQMSRPWFPFGYNTEGNYYTTEDAMFATKLQELKIPWYIDHDASKMISHVGNKKFVWNEIKLPEPEVSING